MKLLPCTLTYPASPLAPLQHIASHPDTNNPNLDPDPVPACPHRALVHGATCLPPDSHDHPVTNEHPWGAVPLQVIAHGISSVGELSKWMQVSGMYREEPGRCNDSPSTWLGSPTNRMSLAQLLMNHNVM